MSLQYELGEGPCLSVRKDQDTLIVVDLATEERWPVWAPQASTTSPAPASTMSLLVFTGDDSRSALSLHAVGDHQFDVDDVAVAQARAGHLALSMSPASGRSTSSGMAIISRLVIRRAEGILMERLDVTADQAFDYLRRISSTTTRKLRWRLQATSHPPERSPTTPEHVSRTQATTA